MAFSYKTIFTPSILAFLLAELLAIQYYLLNIEYWWPVIFINFLRSKNA